MWKTFLFSITNTADVLPIRLNSNHCMFRRCWRKVEWNAKDWWMQDLCVCGVCDTEMDRLAGGGRWQKDDTRAWWTRWGEVRLSVWHQSHDYTITHTHYWSLSASTVAHATSHRDTLESTWNTIHSPFYFRNLTYFQVTLFKKWQMLD